MRCKIWQNQQRKLPDGLVGWNGESREELPNDVSSVTNKTRVGYCGTHKHMSYWNSRWSSMCPSCGNVTKIKVHVMRCRDPGRKKMMISSVGELIDWMYEIAYDYDMATSMSKYLMSQGDLAFWTR